VRAPRGAGPNAAALVASVKAGPAQNTLQALNRLKQALPTFFWPCTTSAF